MPVFVPVVDNEKSRSERDDDAADLQQHRRFDNPHGLHAPAASKPKEHQGANQGRKSKIKRRKVEQEEPAFDCGGPQRAPAQPTAAARAPSVAVGQPPSIDPLLGKDGWEPYGMTGLLHADHLALFFDPRTSTFFRSDPATGELLVVPRDDDDTSATPDAAAEGEGDGPELLVGTESWTGRKETNEDRYVESEPLGRFAQFFAVYDGHAGTECAEYVRKHLHGHVRRCFNRASAEYHPPPPNEAGRTAVDELAGCLTQLIECREQQAVLGEMGDDEEVAETRKHLDELVELQLSEVAAAEENAKASRGANRHVVEAMQTALRDGCRMTDQAYLGLARMRQSQCGSTAICAVVHGKPPDDVRVCVANVGDSRAVLCRSGRAVALSEDHKPDRADETKRIRRAGGQVIDAGGIARVASAAAMSGARGTIFLSVARSFGDIGLKEPDPLVIAEPDLEVRHLLPGDTAIVLGCDGIWDVLSNQDAVDIAIEHAGKPNEAAAAIVRAAYTKKSEDNLTAMVIDLTPWARASLPEDPGPGGEDSDEDDVEPLAAAVDAELDMFG